MFSPRRALALAALWLAVPLAHPELALARRGAMTVHVPPFDVPALHNREICTFVPLRVHKPMDISEIVIVNQGGSEGFTSHHLIVYAYQANLQALVPSAGKVVDDAACLKLGSGDPRALQIVATSQSVSSRQRMPPGTALRIEPQSGAGRRPVIGLVLNSHWINGTDTVKRARATVKIVLANPRTVKRQLKPIFEAVASGLIDVPPGKTARESWDWGPGIFDFGGFFGGTTNPTGPACVTMLISHMHRRGILFTEDLVAADGTETRLYSNTVYSDPPTLNLSPPMLIRPGEKIHYECTHDNATDPKLGCEEQAGVAPGRPVIQTFPSLTGAAKRCGTPGPDPTECPATDPAYPGRAFTGNCVQANLVFGFNSDDDMCIMPGYYYDADPAAPAGHECDL